MIPIKIKLLNENAKVPTYGSDGAAAFDFYACKNTVIPAFMQAKVPLGIACEIPKGYVMLIMPRSSTGAKTPLRMCNSVGVIDSDYRGEICALYENDGHNNTYLDYEINTGERIAQGFVLPVEQVEFNVVDKLSTTSRGEGGFGSTGK